MPKLLLFVFAADVSNGCTAKKNLFRPVWVSMFKDMSGDGMCSPAANVFIANLNWTATQKSLFADKIFREKAEAVDHLCLDGPRWPWAMSGRHLFSDCVYDLCFCHKEKPKLDFIGFLETVFFGGRISRLFQCPSAAALASGRAADNA